ncbi:hypothetical protein FGO68_gene5399 [Halteria grandinella]|uniref:Uncharacterized protein n=1 Tax=Halteria grandinella TaxID=5974 RepID=A0A8J8NP29_HALGN|nr:hypothetical protein FGO68_gene5399 [Halteria grandinella]
MPISLDLCQPPRNRSEFLSWPKTWQQQLLWKVECLRATGAFLRGCRVFFESENRKAVGSLLYSVLTWYSQVAWVQPPNTCPQLDFTSCGDARVQFQNHKSILE